jgi:hypothetical protein
VLELPLQLLDSDLDNVGLIDDVERIIAVRDYDEPILVIHEIGQPHIEIDLNFALYVPAG